MFVEKFFAFHDSEMIYACKMCVMIVIWQQLYLHRADSISPAINHSQTAIERELRVFFFSFFNFLRPAVCQQNRYCIHTGVDGQHYTALTIYSTSFTKVCSATLYLSHIHIYVGKQNIYVLNSFCLQ